MDIPSDVTRLLAAYNNYDNERPVEIEPLTGTTPAACMSDWDWLSVAVVEAEAKWRVRWQYPAGHWSSWHYIYAPALMIVPQEL